MISAQNQKFINIVLTEAKVNQSKATVSIDDMNAFADMIANGFESDYFVGLLSDQDFMLSINANQVKDIVIPKDDLEELIKYQEMKWEHLGVASTVSPTNTPINSVMKIAFKPGEVVGVIMTSENMVQLYRQSHSEPITLTFKSEPSAKLMFEKAVELIGGNDEKKE